MYFWQEYICRQFSEKFDCNLSRQRKRGDAFPQLQGSSTQHFGQQECCNHNWRVEVIAFFRVPYLSTFSNSCNWDYPNVTVWEFYNWTKTFTRKQNASWMLKFDRSWRCSSLPETCWCVVWNGKEYKVNRVQSNNYYKYYYNVYFIIKYSGVVVHALCIIYMYLPALTH